MPLVTPTPISVLLDPPSTSNPSSFDAKADAFLGALPNFKNQANQLATDTNTNAQHAQDQATTATQQASTATTQATNAAASAAAAAAAAGVTAWNAATNYSVGAVVYSLSNYQTYRAKVAGVDATDPALNSTKWAQILPPSMPVIVNSATVTLTPVVNHVLQFSGAIAITMPTSPYIGMEINIDVANGRFDNYLIYNLTDKIQGLTENCFLDVAGPLLFVYTGSTLGWRLR